MIFTLIKKKISNAINFFYLENKEVIKNWKSSRNYIYALAKILEREFDSWDVDCNFVHYREPTVSNFLDNDRFCNAKDISVTCEECLNKKWCKACPDIIIHRRNTQDNLLIIQIELNSRNQSKTEQNLSLIKSYINDSGNPYEYGLILNWGPSQDQVLLTWLGHKNFKGQESHSHKKIREEGNYIKDSNRHYKIPKVEPEIYVVGLLDILGTKEKLKNATSELRFINSLNRNYLFLDFLKTSGMGNFIIQDNVIIRIYSDNIIFAQKSTCASAPFFDFNIIRLYMAFFQLYLLSSGLFSRGFITQGKLFINDSFIIGSALVKVHEAEKEIAKYPRVVIDPQLMQLLPDQIHQYPFPPDPLLKKDRIDGYYFLNYYQTMFLDGKKIWYRAISNVTKTIINNLRQSNQETFPKLYWLVKYHNNFCKKNHCEEFIIPKDFITQIQRRVRLLTRHG